MCDLSKDFVLLSKMELIAPGWRSITYIYNLLLLKQF